MIRRPFVLPVVVAAFVSAFAAGGVRAAEPTVTLSINGSTLSATLEDSPAGHEFFAMLPLSLPLQDFNGTEKISDLPQRLSGRDAPEGCTPTAGDLAWYAPWGNLAVFYRDFSWSRGLVPLGRIQDADLSPIADAKNGDVLTITKANPH